ncbi:MAG: S9 family peptidase [Candidatus Heimdallarchaeota archaeon]|nr:S9 family peptidase [Candidatus Heimdallarchaeota archaeon]
MSEKVLVEDYHKLKKLSQIDTNNKLVAWVETSAATESDEYKSFIKIFNKENGESRQFTSGMKKDYYPKFSDNGKYLAFLSTRNEKPQIYLVNLDGGEALPLTEEKNGVLEFDWHIDSKTILYKSMKENEESKPKEAVGSKFKTKFEVEQKEREEKERKRKISDPIVINNLIYRTSASFLDENQFSQLSIIDIETKESKRITKPGFNYSMGRWSGKSTIVTLVKQDKPIDVTDRVNVVEIDLEKNNDETILQKEFEPTIFISTPNVNPHNRDIILVPVLEEIYEISVLAQIYKWKTISKESPKIINKEFDRSISEIIWTSESNALTLVHDHGYSKVMGFNYTDLSFNEIYDSKFSVDSFAAKSKDEIYMVGTSPDHPYAIWKYSTNDGMQMIYEANSEYLNTHQICIPEEFWLTNSDGTKFQGWFFEAKNRNETKSPAILSIHGGPHVMWNNAGSMWHEWQSQVSAGYSVIALNPVGSDGYGEEFLRVISGKWGIDDARDLLQAIDHFVEKGQIDPERLYMTGGSYAGYQVANMITTDHRFKAACAQRGVYNLMNLDAGSDLSKFPDLEYTGDVWSTRDLLWDHSPVSKARDIQTPLLIIHSENDYRVNIAQAEELFHLMRSNGKEVTFVRYPSEGHELSRSGKPIHVIDRLQRMITWFKDH